jgi:hypothetical protein
MGLVKNGSIAITSSVPKYFLQTSGDGGSRLNDKNNDYFKPRKDLRQGDPMSHLLFNLVADVFTRMLVRAAQGGYITGLTTSLYPEGVISIQYADDTLLFLCYDKLSGMKINYHKSDMIPINLNGEEARQYTKIFCCKVGSFPFRYLGVSLHYDKPRREDIQPVVDLIIKRIPS